VLLTGCGLISDLVGRRVGASRACGTVVDIRRRTLKEPAGKVNQTRGRGDAFGEIGHGRLLDRTVAGIDDLSIPR